MVKRLKTDFGPLRDMDGDGFVFGTQAVDRKLGPVMIVATINCGNYSSTLEMRADECKEIEHLLSKARREAQAMTVARGSKP